jgi:hypothetical protein
MANRLFLIVILIYGTCVYAQQTTSGISPDGNLIAYSVTPANNNASVKVPLRSMDATTDEGIMTNKLREGYGRHGYSDPSINGQNRRHRFMDRRHMTPYTISTSRYVSRSTITRSSAKANEVKLRILQNGDDNTDIEDFYMAYDSGSEYRMSNIYGIQNVIYPLHLKVTYRSWNTFHAVQNDVRFEFTIYSPGTWNVTLFN